jgi:hypothetical protein
LRRASPPQHRPQHERFFEALNYGDDPIIHRADENDRAFSLVSVRRRGRTRAEVGSARHQPSTEALCARGCATSPGRLLTRS